LSLEAGQWSMHTSFALFLFVLNFINLRTVIIKNEKILGDFFFFSYQAFP